MKSVVVTGCKGFLGTNLMIRLAERRDVDVRGFDVEDSEAALMASLQSADYVFHLAGVNRPQNEADYSAANWGVTRRLVDQLIAYGRPVSIIATSSVQATLDNAYGRSKRKAEEELERYRQTTGARVWVYRLTNVFGKWARPFYNSVVATFSHQIASGLSPTVSDPATRVEFVHVDDVLGSFLGVLDGVEPLIRNGFPFAGPTFTLSLGDLADQIRAAESGRHVQEIPDLTERSSRQVFGTYLSYLRPDQLSGTCQAKVDERGYLFEMLKSRATGQVFFSRTKPGVTRGNHYHHRKAEKFCVVEGEALIRLRRMDTGERADLPVSGGDCRVVDIPPGYAHSITNVGSGDLLTVFWSSEVFSAEDPDTHHSIP